MTARQKEQILKNLYYGKNSPAYLSGVNTLYKLASASSPNVRITKTAVQRFLDQQQIYNLHRPLTTPTERLPVRVLYVDALWMADLIDMSKYSKSNDGFRWILTVIDVFSRFAFAERLKSKKNSEVLNGFATIFQRSRRKPDNLVTDDGGEFFSQESSKFFLDQNITHYSTSSVFKASSCERFNRTLKNTIFKHFTLKKSYAWVNDLQTFVSQYNKRPNRATGVSPVSVDSSTQREIYLKQKVPFTKLPKIKFSVGDKVRFALPKTVFKKSYLQTYSKEIFEIHRVIKGPVVTYQLTDAGGKIVETWKRKSERGKLILSKNRTPVRFYSSELIFAER